MHKILIVLIKAYKVALSPYLGKHCRFHPGCANYAIEALEKHGAVAGGWLAMKRIGRCHPWNAGGYDPVPDSRNHVEHVEERRKQKSMTSVEKPIDMATVQEI